MWGRFKWGNVADSSIIPTSSTYMSYDSLKGSSLSLISFNVVKHAELNLFEYEIILLKCNKDSFCQLYDYTESHRNIALLSKCQFIDSPLIDALYIVTTLFSRY